MKNKIFGFLIVSLLLVACEKAHEPQEIPRPAMVIKVSKASAANSMVLIGEVRSRFESNQGFRIKGKIIERKVEVGSVIKRGQILAKLDNADANLNLQAVAADVQVAEANFALSQAEVERQHKLFNKKFISQSALEIKEAEYKTALAKLNQVKSQEAISTNQFRYTTLFADRDGVVTKIHAEPGQVVDAGEIIAQIDDINKIEVLVAVPESRVKKLMLGDKVTMKLWIDHEKTYQGIVREISPAANPATRAFDVRIAIQNPDEAIKLGMTAAVRFEKDEAAAIIIPLAALTQIDGKNIVWVIDGNGIAIPRVVTMGQYTENGVTITMGLQSGEMIAIAGVHTLTKGQKVQPKFESVL